jgi:hypothetical protein
MIIPFFGRKLDERFVMHRLRSTSLAGVTGGLVAVGLWAYYYYAERVWSWDLFAVALTMVGVKLAAMAWYRFTD